MLIDVLFHFNNFQAILVTIQHTKSLQIDVNFNYAKLASAPRIQMAAEVDNFNKQSRFHDLAAGNAFITFIMPIQTVSIYH